MASTGFTAKYQVFRQIVDRQDSILAHSFKDDKLESSEEKFCKDNQKKATLTNLLVEKFVDMRAKKNLNLAQLKQMYNEVLEYPSIPPQSIGRDAFRITLKYFEFLKALKIILRSSIDIFEQVSKALAIPLAGRALAATISFEGVENDYKAKVKVINDVIAFLNELSDSVAAEIRSVKTVMNKYNLPSTLESVQSGLDHSDQKHSHANAKMHPTKIKKQLRRKEITENRSSADHYQSRLNLRKRIDTLSEQINRQKKLLKFISHFKKMMIVTHTHTFIDKQTKKVVNTIPNYAMHFYLERCIERLLDAEFTSLSLDKHLQNFPYPLQFKILSTIAGQKELQIYKEEHDTYNALSTNDRSVVDTFVYTSNHQNSFYEVIKKLPNKLQLEIIGHTRHLRPEQLSGNFYDMLRHLPYVLRREIIFQLGKKSSAILEKNFYDSINEYPENIQQMIRFEILNHIIQQFPEDLGNIIRKFKIDPTSKRLINELDPFEHPNHQPETPFNFIKSNFAFLSQAKEQNKLAKLEKQKGFLLNKEKSLLRKETKTARFEAIKNDPRIKLQQYHNAIEREKKVNPHFQDPRHHIVRTNEQKEKLPVFFTLLNIVTTELNFYNQKLFLRDETAETLLAQIRGLLNSNLQATQIGNTTLTADQHYVHITINTLLAYRREAKTSNDLKFTIDNILYGFQLSQAQSAAQFQAQKEQCQSKLNRNLVRKNDIQANRQKHFLSLIHKGPLAFIDNYFQDKEGEFSRQIKKIDDENILLQKQINYLQEKFDIVSAKEWLNTKILETEKQLEATQTKLESLPQHQLNCEEFLRTSEPLKTEDTLPALFAAIQPNEENPVEKAVGQFSKPVQEKLRDNLHLRRPSFCNFSAHSPHSFFTECVKEELASIPAIKKILKANVQTNTHDLGALNHDLELIKLKEKVHLYFKRICENTKNIHSQKYKELLAIKEQIKTETDLNKTKMLICAVKTKSAEHVNFNCSFFGLRGNAMSYKVFQNHFTPDDYNPKPLPLSNGKVNQI